MGDRLGSRPTGTVGNVATPPDQVRKAFRDGIRSGFVTIFRFGGGRPAPMRMSRTVGSFRTDRISRYSDVERFGRDVQHRSRDLVG